MTIEKFFDLVPQKTFLVQGSEDAFDTLIGSTMVRYPLTNALSVARFTMVHAKALVDFINEGNGEDRIFICFFSFFSPDAAEVLLKALEEPDMNTTVILMTPYPYLVPATIRSRTRLIHNDWQREATPHAASPILSRTALLAQIKDEFASDAEDDAATRRAKAVLILDMLEAHVRTVPAKAAIIYKAKGMLFSANMPTKYILEYAASMVL